MRLISEIIVALHVYFILTGFECEAKRVTLCSNESSAVLTQDMMSAAHVTYIIKSDYDLQGDTIIVPEGCRVKFKKGSFTNGVLIGTETILESGRPFLGPNMMVKGCLTGKLKNTDTDIFKSVEHNPNEIQVLINLSRIGVKTVMSKGEYHEVDTIWLLNDVDIDFSGGHLYSKIDRSKCSCGFFYMEPWVETGIKTITIKNATLDGQIPSYGLEMAGGRGTYRRAVQIFNVDNVVLDNLDIKNFWYGTSGSFTEDVKSRYELYEVAIMNSIKCSIKNCSLTSGRGDGFKVSPRNISNNYTEFVGNHSKRFYGTCFEIVDGRCLVKNNVIEDFNGSALNVFCYNSEICNNKFFNSHRGCAVDLTEGEYYSSRNVYIHDNVQEGGVIGFAEICGEGITLKNNTYTGNGHFCRILHGYSTDVSAFLNVAAVFVANPGINIVGNQASNINYGVTTNYKKGEETLLSQILIEDNAFTLKTENIVDKENGGSVLLHGYKNIKIKNNIFRNSLGSIMSAHSSNWITFYDCSGELIVVGNIFSQDEGTLFYSKNASITTGTDNEFSSIVFEGNESSVKSVKPSVKSLKLKSGKQWALPSKENKGF